MASEKLNLVAIGATGVGKSTFLNYLLGTSKYVTHRSRPSTGRGFFQANAEIRGFPVRLIDSWGLEAGKADEWLQYLENELLKRESQHDITKCFHAVCYIISAASNRIQDFDLSILRHLISKGYSVIVVLNKAAKVSHDVVDDLKHVIAVEFGDEISVVAADSVSETLRDGHRTERFGAEEFEGQILLRFWDTIKFRIPRIVGDKLTRVVEELWDEPVVENLAKRSKFDFHNCELVREQLVTEADSLKRKIRDQSVALRKAEVQRARRMYYALAECLSHGGDWELADDYTPLDVSYSAWVENPTFLPRAVDYFGFDSTKEQRQRLIRAAKKFSQELKTQINERLVQQIGTSIGSVRIDLEHLKNSKPPNIVVRFCRWLADWFERTDQ